jgi:hypothetical protein
MLCASAENSSPPPPHPHRPPPGGKDMYLSLLLRFSFAREEAYLNAFIKCRGDASAHLERMPLGPVGPVHGGDGGPLNRVRAIRRANLTLAAPGHSIPFGRSQASPVWAQRRLATPSQAGFLNHLNGPRRRRPGREPGGTPAVAPGQPWVDCSIVSAVAPPGCAWSAVGPCRWWRWPEGQTSGRPSHCGCRAARRWAR